MTKDEIIEMARQAGFFINDKLTVTSPFIEDICISPMLKEFAKLVAEKAIKEALAHPEQEPVAWMFQHEETGRTVCIDAQQLGWGFEKGNPRLKKIAPLYTTSPQRKPLLDEFGYWWFEYGSGLFPLEGEDQEEHSYRVATAAWQAAHGIKGD